MLADLRAHLVPTSVSVLGEARLGYTRLGDGSVYNKILNDIDIEINCPEGLSGKSKLFSK